MQTDFIALYRGQTVAEARLIALTADPEIVHRFMHELVGRDADEDLKRPTPLHLTPLLGGETADD